LNKERGEEYSLQRKDKKVKKQMPFRLFLKSFLKAFLVLLLQAWQF